MNKEIYIDKLSVVELKALAFDRIALVGKANQELELLNSQIKKMEEYKSPEEVEATPVEETVEDTPTVEDTTIVTDGIE